MGNHEYCDECGASDFHIGTPCNPERKAAFQAIKQKAARWVAAAKAKAVAELPKIQEIYPEAEIDRNGDIVIPWTTFADDTPIVEPKEAS